MSWWSRRSSNWSWFFVNKYFAVYHDKSWDVAFDHDFIPYMILSRVSFLIRTCTCNHHPVKWFEVHHHWHGSSVEHRSRFSRKDFRIIIMKHIWLLYFIGIDWNKLRISFFDNQNRNYKRWLMSWFPLFHNILSVFLNPWIWSESWW